MTPNICGASEACAPAVVTAGQGRQRSDSPKASSSAVLLRECSECGDTGGHFEWCPINPAFPHPEDARL